jgi:hypothetical protein
MAKFGWAYVDCDASITAFGPTGSIQFMSGAGMTSGSSMLMYHTAAYAGQPSTMILSGNLIVTGTLSASVVNYENISIIDATGSTYFGNSNDDTHQRIGSLVVQNAASTTVLSASVTTEAVHVRGFNGLYEAITTTSVTASTPSYIIGVQNSSNVQILIPSASRTPAATRYCSSDHSVRKLKHIRCCRGC